MVCVNHKNDVQASVFVGNSDDTLFFEITGSHHFRRDCGLFNVNELVKEIAFCDLLSVECRGWLLDHVCTIHQTLVMREVVRQERKGRLAWNLATVLVLTGLLGLAIWF